MDFLRKFKLHGIIRGQFSYVFGEGEISFAEITMLIPIHYLLLIPSLCKTQYRSQGCLSVFSLQNGMYPFSESTQKSQFHSQFYSIKPFLYPTKFIQVIYQEETFTCTWMCPLFFSDHYFLLTSSKLSWYYSLSLKHTLACHWTYLIHLPDPQHLSFY